MNSVSGLISSRPFIHGRAKWRSCTVPPGQQHFPEPPGDGSNSVPIRQHPFNNEWSRASNSQARDITRESELKGIKIWSYFSKGYSNAIMNTDLRACTQQRPKIISGNGIQKQMCLAQQGLLRHQLKCPLSSVNNPTHYFFPLNSLCDTRISFDRLVFQLTNLMKTLNKPVGF